MKLPLKGKPGDVLTADSSQPFGVKWAAAAGGGGGSDRRWTVGTGEAAIDEFDDASQSGGAKWAAPCGTADED